jgi:hypothetical protein
MNTTRSARASTGNVSASRRVGGSGASTTRTTNPGFRKTATPRVRPTRHRAVQNPVDSHDGGGCGGLFQENKPVTLFSSFGATRFPLWDERLRKLVGFRHVKELRSRAKGAEKKDSLH